MIKHNPFFKRKTPRRQISQCCLIILCFALILTNTAHSQTLNLKFTALDGRKVDISSLKGKIVLIDCWATWYTPCLKEMAHIKEMYAKYHEKGFEVIGISMDGSSEKERLIQIVKQKNILWPQRFEGKGFQDDSFRVLYSIESLPTVYLLDKEGNILDMNARGDRLEPLIKQHLGL